MTIDTVELRKIQYAQELAAYTMRQWMLTRDSPDPQHGSAPESTSGPTSAAQTTAPSSGRETRDNNHDISGCPSADLHLAGRLTVCYQLYSMPPPIQSLSTVSGQT
jgi:hypothetical protein